MPRIALVLAVAAALGIPLRAHGVRLDDDGRGQALVFPYYTVQTSNGDSYNTYLSVVNHTADAKALRVRFREGRASREVASFNLYLSPNDVWTGAVVPGATASGAPRLITVDRSCTSPAFTGGPATLDLDFRNALYSGSNDDGNGTGLDRSREGFVEMIEMATLTGTSAAAVTHTAQHVPADCAAVQGNATLQFGAPSGGLSGTETLINVANGLNFDLDAVTLADLSRQPFYRPASDPYPGFAAAEIDPVSVVVSRGTLYRSVWGRPVDAVSAVLMRTSYFGEFVLDDVTSSNTDVVVTFPTRGFYVSSAGVQPPFTGPPLWAPTCGRVPVDQDEAMVATAFTREEGSMSAAFFSDISGQTTGREAAACASTVVFDVSNGSAHTANAPATHVLGSLTRGFTLSSLPISPFKNGWLRATFIGQGSLRTGLTSLPASTRLDLASGVQTSGPHAFYGLPFVGFTARTFQNGTLVCAAGACQGNYGGAFPLQYTRSISP